MNSSRNISPMDYPDELGSSRFPPTKRKNSRNGNGSVALGLDLGVERFFSELFNRVSQSPLGLRDDDAGGGLRTPCGGARHSFEDNGNDSKQPLLIKSRKRNGHDGVHGQVASAGYCLHVDKSNGSDSTTPLLAAGDDDCECVCSSWVDARKSSQQTATERDAEESRGRGTYSLHAVLGQGSFGRIHLASWRGNDYASDVVRDTPAARPRDFLTSSKRRPDSRNERYANDNNLASFGELHTSLTSFLTGQAQHRHVDDAGAGASSATSASRTLPRGSLKMEEFGARFSSQGRSYIRQRQPSPRHPENPSFHRPTPKILEPFGAGDEAAERSRPLDVGEGCEAGIVLEDTGEVADTGDPIRLRALKSVCKRKVTEKGLIHHMETELEVLKQCAHPHIVSLRPGGHFQTSGHLHLVLDYCPGGDLFSLLGREGRLDETQAKVCSAQLALALRHLHSRHIVYRDLKPENVCLDSRGRVILVDFSLAKTGLDRVPGGKTYTFCGSAAYVAPEMLERGGHDTRVDLWALGCVVFEALVGAHPFRQPRGEKSDRQALFEKIRQGRPSYPSFLSASALSLLQGLLAVNPDNRLGFSPVGSLRRAASATSRNAPVTSQNLNANTQNGPSMVHVVTPLSSMEPPHFARPASSTIRPASSSFDQRDRPHVRAEWKEGVDVGRGRGSSWGTGDFSRERFLERSGNLRRYSADDTLDRGSEDAARDQSSNTRRQSATKASSIRGGAGAGDVGESTEQISNPGQRSLTNLRASAAPATISTYKSMARLTSDPDDQRGVLFTHQSNSARGAHLKDGAKRCTANEESLSLGGPAGESDIIQVPTITGDNGKEREGKSGGDMAQPLLLEHAFFRGLPGWGGPGTDGAWDELKLAASSLMSPELRHVLDVRHFDPKFTSQTVELTLQGHPHKGGPTPSFDSFDWRPDECIELAQVEERGKTPGFPGFLESMASALWC